MTSRASSQDRSALRRIAGAACVALSCASGVVQAGPPTAAAPAAVHAVIHTTAGPLTVELYPALAPRTVALFLARAALGPLPEGADRVAPYAGTQVCELRAHGYALFGCLPFAAGGPAGPAPHAAGLNRQPDEIDGAAMGLAARPIADAKERDWLWQREVFPYYQRLREGGKPVPPRLQQLVDAIVTRGDAGRDALDGKSHLWYFEALGYAYTPGLSALPIARGTLLAANFYPGEADERFMVALGPLPEREGRATVFGRVVGSEAALDAIERAPIDKSHRTLAPLMIDSIDREGPPSAAGETSR